MVKKLEFNNYSKTNKVFWFDDVEGYFDTPKTIEYDDVSKTIYLKTLWWKCLENKKTGRWMEYSTTVDVIIYLDKLQEFPKKVEVADDIWHSVWESWEIHPIGG